MPPHRSRVSLTEPSAQKYPASQAPVHNDEFISDVLPNRPAGHCAQTPSTQYEPGSQAATAANMDREPGMTGTA
jgi:hypothetical protein